jgi:hypothetical protein
MAVAATPAGSTHAAGTALDLSRRQPTADTPITGTILDEKGAGLPGVTVVLKGTTTGMARPQPWSFLLSATSAKKWQWAAKLPSR